jgi:hypothetical protein
MRERFADSDGSNGRRQNHCRWVNPALAHTAYQRLKQELRAAAAGEPVNAPELSRRAAVLASRVSSLEDEASSACQWSVFRARRRKDRTNRALK